MLISPGVACRSGITLDDLLMAIAIVAAYLIGSIPFALICARRWGASDLRLIGPSRTQVLHSLQDRLLLLATS